MMKNQFKPLTFAASVGLASLVLAAGFNAEAKGIMRTLKNTGSSAVNSATNTVGSTDLLIDGLQLACLFQPVYACTNVVTWRRVRSCKECSRSTSPKGSRPGTP